MAPRISGLKSSIRSAPARLARYIALSLSRKQILAVFLGSVEHRDADAAGQHEVAPADLHRRAQRPSHPLGKHGDIPGLGILGNQDGELQRAHAGERILRRNVAREPACDGQQHAVVGREIGGARLVFQRVQIDEEHGRLDVLLLGARSRRLQPVEEQLPVRQARQPVPDRVMKQPLLRPLLLGDVPEQADAAKGAGVPLLRYRRAQLVPEIAAIRPLHAEFEIDIAALPLADRPQGQAHALAVGGMKMVQPGIRSAAERAGAHAKWAFDFRPGVDFVAASVPFPNAGARGFERHHPQLELARILAHRSGLASLERILRNGEPDQGKEHHKACGKRRDDDVTGNLAHDSHGGGEQPDHEQHPGRHKRQRPLLAAQGKEGNQRASNAGDGNEGKPGEARGELRVYEGEYDQPELDGDPAGEGDADPAMPEPEIEKDVDENDKACGESGLGRRAVGAVIFRGELEELVPKTEIHAQIG